MKDQVGNPVRGVNTHKEVSKHGNTEQNRPGQQAPSLRQTQKVGVSDRLGASGTREKLGAKSEISRGRTVLCVWDIKPSAHQIHFLLFLGP